jgi:peptide/nickel transport system substrate-binding protein
MKKVTKFLICLLLISLLITGCSGGDKDVPSDPKTETPSGTSGEPKYKKEIIIAIADEFTTIDPMETTAESNQIVQDCTHDLLTDTNLLTMQNEGELVDSWEMIEPDHWRFKLKENVRFHDGTILDVDDVIFTFERGKDKSTTSAYISKIKDFIKVDDLTFEVKLHNGDVDFNYVLAANSLAILSKEAFETMPEEEAVKIGTGPWKFEEFVPGDYVSLVRFEECTLYDVPNTERLVFRMIPEASSRMIALENGEVDAIMSPSPTDYNRLSESSNLKLITETGRGQHFIGFNCSNTNSIVSNPEFRKAIAHAINKEEMVIAAWDGYAQVSTSIMCRDMEYYADIEGIPYDPDKAKEMLKELNAEGITLNLITSDASHRVKMAENFQAQMARYGITVNVEFMQQAALIERLQNDKNTEVFVLSWTPGMNADYMYRNPIHSQGGRSFYANLNNSEIDALIDAAAAEVDTTKRAQMYEELQVRLTTELVPWVPIAQATLTMGADKDVTGLLLHPGLVHQFKTAEKIIN